MPQRRVESISLLIDGSVSLFGLQCQVDDLQITYLVSKDDFFNPQAWDIDLAGLAVSADMAGLTLAGGLLKQKSDAGIEYLGMLLARFGVYGITIYGGYGEGDDDGEKFVAFFAVGLGRRARSAVRRRSSSPASAAASASTVSWSSPPTSRSSATTR